MVTCTRSPKIVRPWSSRCLGQKETSKNQHLRIKLKLHQILTSSSRKSRYWLRISLKNWSWMSTILYLYRFLVYYSHPLFLGDPTLHKAKLYGIAFSRQKINSLFLETIASLPQFRCLLFLFNIPIFLRISSETQFQNFLIFSL